MNLFSVVANCFSAPLCVLNGKCAPYNSDVAPSASTMYCRSWHEKGAFGATVFVMADIAG